MNFMWKHTRLGILPAMFAAAQLFADKAPEEKHPHEELPWLTGPLIAQSSEVIQLGHVDIEPYFFAVANTGQYDNSWHSHKTTTVWNFLLEPEMLFGLTEWMDLFVLPAISYNLSDHGGQWAWNDPIVGLEFQLYRNNYYYDDWIPNVKIAVREVFPMGQYDRLDPRKNRVQIAGGGSFVTQFELALGKLVHITGRHFLSTRFVAIYSVPAPIKVHGFSFYGGGEGSNAVVYVPQSLNCDLAFEVTFNQNWAFALDVIGDITARTRFKGEAGFNLNGTPATLSSESSFSFTLAPAIEYNWSQQFGIIAGVWFTAAGKNTLHFLSPTIAFNYYH